MKRNDACHFIRMITHQDNQGQVTRCLITLMRLAEPSHYHCTTMPQLLFLPFPHMATQASVSFLPNGTLKPTGKYSSCSSYADTLIMRCRTGVDQCLPNGLCFKKDHNRTLWREPYTDQSWNAAGFLNLCNVGIGECSISIVSLKKDFVYL